jgi:hypothetical protein
MTGRDGNQSQEDFKPSDAAMNEFRASRRRNIRPGLVFLPMMFLVIALQKYGAPTPVLVTLTSVAGVVSLVTVGQNHTIQRRADQRLKVEKRAWEERPTGPL